MMHFELKVNGDEITKVSVVRIGQCAVGGKGWFVYEWDAWRPDAEEPQRRLHRYCHGSVSHRYDDGIEELAIKVLSDYRRHLRAREDIDDWWAENTYSDGTEPLTQPVD